MPKITVIVPVYKVEPYLRRCIDSILAQTFADFELILVDDGSPDNCGAICDEYAAGDRRIHVIHQPNGGLSAARNAGIDWAFANSDSEWLAFVDSDDWVHPQYLEYLYRAVQESGLSISVCDFRKTNRQEAYNEEPFQQQVLDGLEFFVSEKSVVATTAWAKLYDKMLFHDLRYPVGKIHEDEFVTWRLLAWAGKVAFLDSKLYYYYQNERGIMQSEYSLKRLDAIEALEQQRCYFSTINNGGYYKKWVASHLHSYCDHIPQLKSIGELHARNRVRRIARHLIFENMNLVKDLEWKKKQTVIEACFPALKYVLIPFKNFFDMSKAKGFGSAVHYYREKIIPRGRNHNRQEAP